MQCDDNGFCPIATRPQTCQCFAISKSDKQRQHIHIEQTNKQTNLLGIEESRRTSGKHHQNIRVVSEKKTHTQKPIVLVSLQKKKLSINFTGKNVPKNNVIVFVDGCFNKI